jgi:purine-binding chemotaxis protein CheW
MDNSTLIQKLEDQNRDNIQGYLESESLKKFVIFSIEERKFAFPAEVVLEIFLSDTIFYLPFCPSYIAGFINRYGDPYTVFDLNMILENKKQSNSKFIIIKSIDDNLAFMVEDVIDILEIPNSSIIPFQSKENENEYCNGIFKYEDSDVWIIQIEKIMEKLEKDIE